MTPVRQGEPRRLRDGNAGPDVSRRLQDALGACANDSVSFERIARRAARGALEQIDRREALGGLRSWGAWLLRPKRAAAVIAALLLLQLGVAAAAEMGPRAVAGVEAWLRRREDVREKRGRASSGAAGGAVAPILAAATPAGSPGPAAAEPGALTSAPDAWPQRPQTSGPATVEAPAIARARSRRRSANPSPATVSELAPTPARARASGGLAGEAAAISRAVALVRSDPRGALALLEDYRRDFPEGRLRGEAALAQVNALRALGKPGEALAVLDRFEGDHFSGVLDASDELRITRLELMLGAGRCDGALPELEGRLAEGSAGRGRARTLLALAACQAKLGRRAESRASLERYLREFPSAARAPEVRRALGAGE
jgi:hypothetical protein